jgi:hypothetical protein
MRHVLLLSVVLLGVSWAAAQSPSTSPTPANPAQTDSGQMAGTQTSASSTGSQNTVEGCLSGSDGKYTLTDKTGTAYTLTGDTSKLAEHVGHEVKITGSTGSGSASSASGTPDSSASASSSSQSLEVSSVKHVSKTCQSGGMAK